MSISLTPQGFRDVYWCWPLNEPVIIEYRGADELHCVNCKTTTVDVAVFGDQHVFMFHIDGSHGVMVSEKSDDVYLTSVELLCVDCKQPIKATITNAQWLKVDFISPEAQCRSCSKDDKKEVRSEEAQS